VLGSAVYLLREPLIGLYTGDPVIIAAALPLLAWVVLFHVADAAQTIAAFVLRAHRIANVPLLVYVFAIWVIGLGGGYVVVFFLDAGPEWLRGAQGFWSMATLGVGLAAVCLAGYLGWTLRRERAESRLVSLTNQARAARTQFRKVRNTGRLDGASRWLKKSSNIGEPHTT